MAYIEEFAAAHQRTLRFGLSAPPHWIDPTKRYLTPARQAEFPRVMLQAVGPVDADDLVAKCFQIHHQLQPAIESWLGVPAVFTIGWVDNDSGGMFKFDENLIVDLLSRQHPPRTLPMHAWLTLPSLELFDLSLATSIAVINKFPQGQGRVMAKHADDVTDMAYKPMLLGDDFLRRIGVLVEL